LLLAFASAVILRSKSQIPDSHNLEVQVPVFTSPRKRVARLCPQALGSFFVASYDSQGYGGSIRPRLHTVLGFEVLAAVVMKSYLFWDITPYGPLKVN
jgi:hypothetical protein